jgi:hypothetical protein
MEAHLAFCAIVFGNGARILFLGFVLFDPLHEGVCVERPDAAKLSSVTEQSQNV